MTGKSPAFQWYPKDWLTDVKVRTMSPAARGIYIDLISHAWLEGCALPDDEVVLARLAGVPLDEFRVLWKEVRPCWKRDRDRIVQPRLQSEARAQKDRRERRSAAGKVGRAKQLDSNAEVLPRQTTGSSSSSASASPSASTTPTESAQASPKRKTPKKTGEPSPQAKCWSHFKSRYETDHRSAGKSPTPSKHLFIQLARLAKAHSEAEVRSRIDNYFEHPPWKHREGPRVLGTLIAQFDSFAAPVNGTASHPSMDSINWKDTEVPK